MCKASDSSFACVTAAWPSICLASTFDFASARAWPDVSTAALSACNSEAFSCFLLLLQDF